MAIARTNNYKRIALTNFRHFIFLLLASGNLKWLQWRKKISQRFWFAIFSAILFHVKTTLVLIKRIVGPKRTSWWPFITNHLNERARPFRFHTTHCDDRYLKVILWGRAGYELIYITNEAVGPLSVPCLRTALGVSKYLYLAIWWAISCHWK